MLKNTFKLNLSSYDKKLIKKQINILNKIFNNSVPIHSSLKKKKFTLLRSPQINKKSREQFELQLFKYNLLISLEACDYIHKKKFNKLLINLLSENLLPNIDLKLIEVYKGKHF